MKSISNRNLDPEEAATKGVSLSSEIPGYFTIRVQVGRNAVAYPVCDFEDLEKSENFGKALAKKHKCDFKNLISETNLAA